jgi:hypothetical protein
MFVLKIKKVGWLPLSSKDESRDRLMARQRLREGRWICRKRYSNK